jgi:hypothetical protein
MQSVSCAFILSYTQQHYLNFSKHKIRNFHYRVFEWCPSCPDRTQNIYSYRRNKELEIAPSDLPYISCPLLYICSSSLVVLRALLFVLLDDALDLSSLTSVLH